MNERTELNQCGCVWKTSALRTVPPNTDVCLQRLRLRGKNRSQQGLLESKKKNVGNHAFFRDN